VAVVMLVCVGFIVSLIILGVMRVRNAKRCGGAGGGGAGGDLADDKQDLDWDNSALTVTVNPMHPDVSVHFSSSAAIDRYILFNNNKQYVQY